LEIAMESLALSPSARKPLFHLVLRAQGVLLGPNAPVLCLDPSGRFLQVSCCLEMDALGTEEAAVILRSTQEAAMQWRAAAAEMEAALSLPPDPDRQAT
jgi:hypothetical protein